MHHVSIRTADIHRAIAFYELLGFELEVRFSTGYTLACWMTGRSGVIEGRIELIQIPKPAPPPDAFGDEHYTGYYHLSFDLTNLAPSLPLWLSQLQERAAQQSDPLTLKILLEPEQQMIGDRCYEVAFLADTDGLPLEFIRQFTG